jgi:hypothetical protein
MPLFTSQDGQLQVIVLISPGTEYGMSERLGAGGARNEYSDRMAEEFGR